MSRQIRQPEIDPLVEAHHNRMQQQGQPRTPVAVSGWILAPPPASPARIPLPRLPPPPPPPPSIRPDGMNNLNMPMDSRPGLQSNPQTRTQNVFRPTAQVTATFAAHTIPRLVRQRRRNNIDSDQRPLTGSPAELLSHFYGSNVTNSFEIVDTIDNSRTTAQEQEEEPSTSEEGDPISLAEQSSNHGLDHWTGSFKCPVCLDYLCQPVILPCGHSFCKTCIWRLVYHRAEEFRNVHPHNLFFFCPSCRKRVQAKNFARYSPANIALSSAIDGYRNSDDRKKSLSGDNHDAKTGITTIERESVSTQTEFEANEGQHSSVANEDSPTSHDALIHDDATQYVSKGEYSLLRQQRQLAQGLGLVIAGGGGGCGAYIGRAMRSESAPPSPTAGGRNSGTNSWAPATDGHVCLRDGLSHDTKKRRREEDDEQDARYRTMLFIAVFVVSALIILDGCVGKSPERRDASPLQIAAWASLLSTAPTFIQCALKMCCSLVNFFTKRLLWWRR